MNGAKRQPVSPNNLNCQDSSSLEVTSVGSPRLPPRKPRPFPRRQRAASCDPAIPSYFDCTQRKYENKQKLYLALFNSILRFCMIDFSTCSCSLSFQTSRAYVLLN